MTTDYTVHRDMNAIENRRFDLNAWPKGSVFKRGDLFANMLKCDAAYYCGTPQQYYAEMMPGSMSARSFARELESARLMGILPFQNVAENFSGALHNTNGSTFDVFLLHGANAGALALQYNQSVGETGEGCHIQNHLIFNLALPIGAAHIIVKAFAAGKFKKLRVVLIDTSNNRGKLLQRIDAQIRSLLYSLPFSEDQEEDFRELGQKVMIENSDIYFHNDAAGGFRLNYAAGPGKYRELKGFSFGFGFHEAAAYFLPGAPGFSSFNLFGEKEQPDIRFNHFCKFMQRIGY